MGFLKEIWGAQTINALIADEQTYQRLANTVVDYTMFTEGAEASAYNGPRISGGSLVDLPASSTTALTYAAINIPFDKKKGYVFPVSSIDQSQTNIDIVSNFSRDAVNSLSSAWDLAIATALIAGTTMTAIAGAAFTEAEILACRTALNAAGAPMLGRYMVVGPELEAGLYTIANFVSADKIGSTTAIRDGFVGRIYGFDVILYNAMPKASTKGQALFYQRNALGFARQKSLGVMAADNALLPGMDVNIYSVFGCTVQEATYIVGRKQA